MAKTCTEMNNNTFVETEGFWRAINIWINKPHVLNRRLWHAQEIYRCTGYVVNTNKALIDSLKEMQNLKISVWTGKAEDILKSFLESHCSVCVSASQSDHDLIEIIVHKLLLRNKTNLNLYTLSFLKRLENVAIFTRITDIDDCNGFCVNFPYAIELLNQDLQLTVIPDDRNSKSYSWLSGTVLPQLKKWATIDESDTMKNICDGSLNLISIDKYHLKYNELKLKYGKDMVAIWPEQTDPAKFVYEDVAIATYLLLLWEQERNDLGSNKMQSFVDLGCGNGLLVYILASEGHQGLGIDVRRRQIWSMYPDHVNLQETTIEPSGKSLFPNTDWIIGNHSDELTPWIPVITARSSYSSRFFLLPCCCYNFDGTKYQRKDSSKSQYNDYLQYIMEVCKICGFETMFDRLKIPSTKRVCLVSKSRLYEENKLEEYTNDIQKFLNCQSGSHNMLPNTDDDRWINSFKPREKIERVRNCTQIEKSIIDDIISTIVKKLLKDIDISKNWQQGQEIEIRELVNVVPTDLLKQLKSECGGIQTVLKNNHHIFSVQFGKVKLRYPRSASDVLNAKKRKRKKAGSDFAIKQRPCWFHFNHPQGCPLEEEKCSFNHK